jgi:hypothetical protein
MTGPQGVTGATGPSGPPGSGTGVGLTIATWVLARNALTSVGTDKTNELVVPVTASPTNCFARCKTAPSGADLIFDINVNGIGLWDNNPVNRLTIPNGQVSGSQNVFDPALATITAGSILTVDVVQVGSVSAGGDITIEFVLTPIT